jgi:thiol-disulfide isomerase/thioredoxin
MSANKSDSNPPISTATPPTMANRLRNLLVVTVAILLSVSVFFGWRTESGSASLSELAEAATPWEVALTNGKPTLMEFYANWCTTCQAMAPQMQDLKAEYGDRVNFAMLNVDNTKWLPEMTRYNVDGIPHFVFLDGDGATVAEAIGEFPRTVMAENLDALVAGAILPHTQVQGQTSQFEPQVTPNANDDPRSHGAQVQGNN